MKYIVIDLWYGHDFEIRAIGGDYLDIVDFIEQY
jgi:hypothetical protein